MAVLKQTKDAILKDADYCCHFCGEEATTVDHKIPLMKGGTNARANLLPACEPCNFTKGTLDYDLYVRYVRRFDRPELNWIHATNLYTDRAVYNIYRSVPLTKLVDIVFERFGDGDVDMTANKIRRGLSRFELSVPEEDLDGALGRPRWRGTTLSTVGSPS